MWLTTTASVIVGGILTMLAAWLTDRRITIRDRERRQEERRERLVTRRNEFQRETLLALQSTSQKLARNAGASLHQDLVAYRTTGKKWQAQQLPDELSDEQLRLNTEVMLLASRVRDEEVRALADRMRSETGQIFQTYDEEDANRRLLTAADIQKELIKRTGQILRGLDEGDTTSFK